MPISDFRVGSSAGERPSQELVDVLYQSLRRQDWFREYAELHGMETVPHLATKSERNAASAWRVVQAEAVLGRKRIQVGFMRQFDAGYRSLKTAIGLAAEGGLLILHCVHRNSNTLPGFTEAMLINDSVVHEFDAIRFLTGEEISSVQVRRGKRSSLAPEGINDPQHVLIETESGILADVEIFVNARYGYEMATQAVFENGVQNIGLGEVTPSFIERFADRRRTRGQAGILPLVAHPGRTVS